MRVTVFGAAGKIGRLVVGRLLTDGHQVVAFARDPGKLDRTIPARIPVLRSAARSAPTCAHPRYRCCNRRVRQPHRA